MKTFSEKLSSIFKGTQIKIVKFENIQEHLQICMNTDKLYLSVADAARGVAVGLEAEEHVLRRLRPDVGDRRGQFNDGGVLHCFAVAVV